jgi:hypothetical protein
MERRLGWPDWLMQTSANMVGTLAAAGVIYLVGVVAGFITADTLVTILSVGGFAAAGLALLFVVFAHGPQRLGRKA